MALCNFLKENRLILLAWELSQIKMVLYRGSGQLYKDWAFVLYAANMGLMSGILYGTRELQELFLSESQE